MRQFTNETCVVCTENPITTSAPTTTTTAAAVPTTRTSESTSEFHQAGDHTSSSFTNRLYHVFVPQIYSVYIDVSVSQVPILCR